MKMNFTPIVIGIGGYPARRVDRPAGKSAAFWCNLTARIMVLISDNSFRTMGLLEGAPVAQLDRASDFESAGRPFESGRARQNLQ